MSEELELPDTVLVRDIENRVFQSIVLQCLAKIPGVALVEGNLLDNLLGRGNEKIRGIYVEQDTKAHAVAIKVEVNVHYGISIPEKTEEIQKRIIEVVTEFTGLHVSSVHVIFKSVVPEDAPGPLPKAEEPELLEV